MSDIALAKGEKFLEDNARKEGVVVTASGLQYKVLTPGTGKSPQATDTVEVHYEGTLIDGTVFDSSYCRGESIEFPLNRVIPGWTEGVQSIKVGGKAKLLCPPNLAYGARGVPGVIPPDSVLAFEVELLDKAGASLGKASDTRMVLDAHKLFPFNVAVLDPDAKSYTNLTVSAQR